MRVRRLGFTSIITIMFILGWFLNGWSAPPTEEREHYKKEAQEKLKDIDRKIDELQRKSAEMKREAKMEFTKDMAELRRKQNAAKREWSKVQGATASKWEKGKADMDAALQDVESTYDRVASRFKEHKE